MPIIEQQIDNQGIYIKFSNGAVFEKTKAEIRAIFQAQGTKAKTRDALKEHIQILIGSHLDASEITLDFNTADGAPSLLEWTAK